MKGKSTSALFLTCVLGAVVAAVLLPQLTPIDQPALAIEGDPSAPAEAGAALQSDVQEALLGLGITTFGTATPVAIGNLLFFTADDGHGLELWRSDGTQAGTVMVKDINTGGDSNPQSLVNMNGVLFFSANGGATGRELWKSDGTARGTVLVRDIRPGVGSNPDHLTVVNGTLYFAANDGVHGNELWKSKGTKASTVLVRDINTKVPTADNSSDPDHLTDINGKLYFVAYDEALGRELWASSGTRSGTRMVRDIAVGPNSSSPEEITELNGFVYFTADDHDLDPDTGKGRELWRTNGVNSQTFVVRDIRPGPDSSKPSHLTNMNGRLFFSADDGEHGIELWRSNGLTVAQDPTGTVLVKDIREGPDSSDPSNLTAFEGTLVFTANDGNIPTPGNLEPHGTELWKSNGSEESTELLADICPGPNSSSPKRLTIVDTSLFFVADDSATGNELWITNGLQGGTSLVKDIRVGPLGSDPNRLTAVDGKLFFTADDGLALVVQLWTSNGKSQGTTPVSESTASPNSSNPLKVTDFNGTLFFTANDGTRGRELWKSDGTNTGTKLVRDILRLAPSADPNFLVSVGRTLFFSALTPSKGRELWKSNGTNSGTVLVKDVFPGQSDSFPSEFTAVGTRVYFSATDGALHGTELWRTDGTANGTVMVKDLFPGEGNSSSPRQLTAFADALYFVADDGTNGRVLWRSDGTEVGTKTVNVKGFDGSVISLPSELTVVGDQLFFVAEDTLHGRELWKIDDIQEDRAAIVEDIVLGPGGSRPQGLTAGTFKDDNGRVIDVLYFTATDSDGVGTDGHGFELWRSNGEPFPGTVMVRDINAVDDDLCGGTCSSTPQSLVNVNGILFFTADDGIHGRELWRSDGTNTGTFMVADIVDGSAGSNPDALTALVTVLGGFVYFVANDGVNGVELWKSDGTNAGTVMLRPFNDTTPPFTGIRPGPFGSNPENLLAIGDFLYFTADVGPVVGVVDGRELWRTDGTRTHTRPVRNIR